MTTPPLGSSSSSSAKITSLNDLPNELLVHICERVPSDYDEQCKAFAAIARVNHLFHSIITPLLYRDFHDCCAKHLRLFGRTILSNQARAELVKYFGGRRDKFSSECTCPMVWNVFAVDQTLEDALTARSPSLKVPLTPAVFSYALTCICTRLQRLDVTNVGSLLMKHLFEKTNTIDSCAVTPFQQLRTLSIAIESDRTYSMQHTTLLFTIRSLQALSIDMAALTNGEEQLSEPIEILSQCTHGTSTVQELTLERCGLPATWIAEMIVSCKTLRHFHLEHYYWDNNAKYYPHVVKALRSHQDTLSYVRINELNGCKVASAQQSDPSELISFQHFTSLTHLDIPLFILSTRTHHREINELLPHCLQIMTVDLRSTREGPSDDFFIMLASATSLHLTALKSVEIICRIEQYEQNGYLPLHFCHLRRLFSSYKVELIYFLEFVQCEFKAAYMESLLSNMRLAGLDGREMADQSSLEAGCLSRTYPSMSCNSRSPDAHHSKRNWGYMKAWNGPSEFDMMT